MPLWPIIKTRFFEQYVAQMLVRQRAFKCATICDVKVGLWDALQTQDRKM